MSEPAANGTAVSANKVFETVELLELILLDVDEITLLLSQRVNKTFYNTIKGSAKLQQALWLRKTSSTEGEDRPFTVNPLLFKHLSNSSGMTFRFAPMNEEYLDRRLRLAFSRPSIRLLNTIWVRCDNGVFTAQSGSWENMIVAKADYIEEDVFCRVRGQSDGQGFEFCRVCEEGLTAGELVARLREGIKKDIERRSARNYIRIR